MKRKEGIQSGTQTIMSTVCAFFSVADWMPFNENWKVDTHTPAHFGLFLDTH